MAERDPVEDLTPKKIVEELDRYIIGQQEAKRIVAIASRNRYRRMKLPPEIRDEVAPKNIMLIGPTGVGKTEIARRLAKLMSAAFIKVEATKFTEVGYVGRDVDSMVRELVEAAVNTVRGEEMQKIRPIAEKNAQERLLELLLPKRKIKQDTPEAQERYERSREKFKKMLEESELEDREVEIQVREKSLPFMQVISTSGIEHLGFEIGEAMGSLFPGKTKTKKVKVAEAREILITEEMEKLLDNEKIVKEGKRRAENLGIIYIDEIDKIVGSGTTTGPDVSREGVQRDLLPLLDGTTVLTRYGPVKTDHILFISAGAFSNSKPSDLIPELQGRFPLRAELKPLTKQDFVRILTEPQNALIKQYKHLLATEGVDIEFTHEAIKEMAQIAWELNSSTQDIGARRLFTVVEKVLNDISFEASEIGPKKIVIDENYVREKLKGIIESEDLKKFIL